MFRRLIFLSVLGCLVCGWFSSINSAEPPVPTSESSSSKVTSEPSAVPTIEAGADAPLKLQPLDSASPPSVDADPLLSELTDLFLQQERTNLRTNSTSANNAAAIPKRSVDYLAAELLLRAARVLEADLQASSDSEASRIRIQAIRSLAVELLTN